MNGDIFNYVGSRIETFVIIVIVLAFLIIALKFMYGALHEIWKKLIEPALKLLKAIAIALIILNLIFLFYTGIMWNVSPSNLPLNLDTNHHTFDIGTYVSVSGTYVDTDAGYTLKPSISFPFGIIPSFLIKKIDGTHASLIMMMGLIDWKYVDKDSLIHTNQLRRSHINGVITFVPDKR